MIITLIIILGLIIGSFLNVVIYRLPRRESVVWPGSCCTVCGQRIKAWDLIPLVSFICLRGRCRYCQEKISWRYPLIESLTAVAFLLLYQQYGLSLKSLAGFILSFVLIAAAFIDLDHGIIPDHITYPGIILGLFFSYFTSELTASFLGALLFGGILFIAALISRGGMGGGDIKLAAAIGTFTGWQGALLAFFLSSLIGGLWGLKLLLTGKANRKTMIRFGPFLALGGWVTYTWGMQIITFYLGLF